MTEDQTNAAILTAIKSLDPADDAAWGADSTPNIDSVSAAAGFAVTWDAMDEALNGKPFLRPARAVAAATAEPVKAVTMADVMALESQVNALEAERNALLAKRDPLLAQIKKVDQPLTAEQERLATVRAIQKQTQENAMRAVNARQTIGKIMTQNGFAAPKVQASPLDAALSNGTSKRSVVLREGKPEVAPALRSAQGLANQAAYFHQISGRREVL